MNLENSDEPISPTRPAGNHYDDLQAALDDLRIPLTVMLARSQLLRRRIRKGTVSSPQECVETLGQIEWAIHELEAKIRALQELRRP